MQRQTSASVSMHCLSKLVMAQQSVESRWLGTPNLVRETSRRGLFGRSKVSTGEKTNEAVKKDFSDIVLPDQLHNHVRALAAVTANTRTHGAPFRHMLFYGPPGMRLNYTRLDWHLLFEMGSTFTCLELLKNVATGTGKSMAAKRLARTAGMDYAIMSGGDVAPLGSGAVSQLHEMFDWAERSRKGLLLFVDEADAFLGQRGDKMSEVRPFPSFSLADSSSDRSSRTAPRPVSLGLGTDEDVMAFVFVQGMRGALNAMLFRTGDQSRDFAVVLATNRPADLDPAVIDRMDESLEFPLPGKDEKKEDHQAVLGLVHCQCRHIGRYAIYWRRSSKMWIHVL